MLALDGSGEGLLVECTRTAPVAFANQAFVTDAELDVVPLDAITPR
jgi:hypothetical protein